MGKNLKITIKNAQIAEALNLSKIKKKLQKPGEEAPKEAKKSARIRKKKEPEITATTLVEEKKPRARLLPSIEEEKAKTPAPKVEEPKKAEVVAQEKPAKGRNVKEKPPIPEPEKEELPLPSIVAPVDEVSEKTPSAPAFSIPVKEGKVSALPSAIAPKKTLQEEEEEKAKEKFPRKELKEFRPKRHETKGGFDSRARQGLIQESEEERWKKRRPSKFVKKAEPQEIIRPTALKVILPITIKDLAVAMKLKSSELISRLFRQGIVVTLNDVLTDETTVQLLGSDFGCDITIDTSEKERIEITKKSIQEEISSADPSLFKPRPPVIAFMGHVDHGKTSLIDAIRKSNLAEAEAGAITQHIGAFSVKMPSGQMITILDTPGHEAFSEMRSRGATVTDIVILVIAGDEGIKEQTKEAILQAKEAKVPIVVALNKSDKAGFDPEKVYRQLADNELLPEAWGGSIITVNCSATTKHGIPQLLEMVLLQAEILELKANPSSRARGTILEAEMHKGLGAIATVLVQNGTLRIGDPIVFGSYFGRVKTMHDEWGQLALEAPPSKAVKITGLSDLAEAGDEFFVVKSEKEARDIAYERLQAIKAKAIQQHKKGSELLKEQKNIKILPIILRADVQGSLEALLSSLKKIKSEKIELSIVNAEVGEISESDIELAAASKAIILGFHTRIESHAEEGIKRLHVTVRLHDIIYHAIDDVKKFMVERLDKLEQENDLGKAKVKTLFKSSQIGVIAGCEVIDGIIKRTSHVRVVRGKEMIFKGKIASLKRLKEDVKEVQKGFECGIVLDRFSDYKEGDILEAFEISYIEQTL